MAYAALELRKEQDAVAQAMEAFCTTKPNSYNTVLAKLNAKDPEADPSGKPLTRARLYNYATGMTAIQDWIVQLFDRTFGSTWRVVGSTASLHAVSSSSSKMVTPPSNVYQTEGDGSVFKGVPMLHPQTSLKTKLDPLPAWQTSDSPGFLGFESPLQHVETDDYRPWCKPGDANHLRPNARLHQNRVYTVTEKQTGLSFYAAFVEVGEKTVFMDYDGNTYSRDEVNHDAAVVWTIPDYTPGKIAGCLNVDGLEVGRQVDWPRPKKTL